MKQKEKDMILLGRDKKIQRSRTNRPSRNRKERKQQKNNRSILRKEQAISRMILKISIHRRLQAISKRSIVNLMQKLNGTLPKAKLKTQWTTSKKKRTNKIRGTISKNLKILIGSNTKPKWNRAQINSTNSTETTPKKLSNLWTTKSKKWMRNNRNSNTIQDGKSSQVVIKEVHSSISLL